MGCAAGEMHSSACCQLVFPLQYLKAILPTAFDQQIPVFRHVPLATTDLAKGKWHCHRVLSACDRTPSLLVRRGNNFGCPGGRPLLCAGNGHGNHSATCLERERQHGGAIVTQPVILSATAVGRFDQEELTFGQPPEGPGAF